MGYWKFAPGGGNRIWAAVYADTRPLDTGWLARFAAGGDVEPRVVWARGVAAELGTLQEVAGAAQWDRWIARYWDDRLTGVPQPLVPREAEAMVWWALALPAVFPAATALVGRSAVAPDEGSLVFHRISEWPALVAAHPDAVARLVLHLLAQRALAFYECDAVIEITRAAVSAGSDRGLLWQLCESLARSGCPSASTLRVEVDAAS